jgi:hypothetical protein
MAIYRRLGRGTKPNKRPPDLNPTYSDDENTTYLTQPHFCIQIQKLMGFPGAN